MGLLLRPDAYYAESPAGVFVPTCEGRHTLPGRSIHPLIERLAPYLNGRHTLAELTANLSGERRESVRALLSSLIERGVLRDIAADARPGHAVDGHDPEIGFLGYFLDSPEHAYREYRDKSVLIIGAGEPLAAVAVTALRSGLRHVWAAITAECPTDTRRLAERAEGAKRDPGQRLDHSRSDPETEGALTTLLDAPDLVIHVADQSGIARAVLLDRLCAEAKVPLAQAVIVGRNAWIGPAGTVPVNGASWTAGRRRLVARRQTHGQPQRPPEPLMPAFDPTSLAVLAGRLIHGVFRSVTGLSAAEGNRMIRIDLATMSGESHPYLPHPFALPPGRAAAGLTARIAELERGPRLAPDTFSRLAATGSATGSACSAGRRSAISPGFRCTCARSRCRTRPAPVTPRLPSRRSPAPGSTSSPRVTRRP